ncbi:MAG: T9SS type A sorting domain-containing protein [Panacibacter sp.]
MRKMYKLFAILALGCLNYETAKAQSCDTTKFEEAISGNWSEISYFAPSAFGPDYPAGYIAGVNAYDYTIKANYFDLSATSYTYVQGVIIKFLKANSHFPANLSKIIYIKVFADSSGQPGSTVLGTAQLTLGDIKSNVDAAQNTQANFAAPVALPASKKFYVGVDVSSLVWLTGSANNDSLSIAATDDDQVLPSTAWDYNSVDIEWTPFSNNWNNPVRNNNDLNVNLWIFPFVSTSAAGCGLLPVNLLSFTAARSNNDVTLKWEVSNEINMKGYSIERADNNGNYKSIAFTAAGDSQEKQSYTVTDRNAFSSSPTVQYRLKQIDADGSIKYSRIISLSHNTAFTDIIFQNPFTGVLKLQLTLASSQKIAIQLYDMQGRMVALQQSQIYSPGTNTVMVNNTGSLKPGTYIIKFNAGDEQIIYKAVKQ